MPQRIGCFLLLSQEEETRKEEAADGPNPPTPFEGRTAMATQDLGLYFI